MLWRVPVAACGCPSSVSGVCRAQQGPQRPHVVCPCSDSDEADDDESNTVGSDAGGSGEDADLYNAFLYALIAMRAHLAIAVGGVTLCGVL